MGKKAESVWRPPTIHLWIASLLGLAVLMGCQVFSVRVPEPTAEEPSVAPTSGIGEPAAALASETAVEPGQAPGPATSIPRPSPTQTQPEPTLVPTASPIQEPTPTADPQAPLLRIHRSGVYCLSGPGGEYPVVQFFLPTPGYPFYYDPAGLSTVDYHYVIIARHFNTHPNSHGWWWKIDRGDEGEDCWVKQYPEPVTSDQVPHLPFMSVIGDVERVPEE